MTDSSNQCRQCQSPFEITDRDRAFYEKMAVPEPSLCPECRLQRRLAWRVERNLYLRKCDLTGKEIISIFPPDHPNKIYHHEAWYSDAWNPLDYGRSYDFDRPFFEQFRDLLAAVPLFSLNVLSLQNCEYVNQCGWSKNCYFTIEADQNEDSMYCYRVFFVKTCVDCAEVFRSERCCECTDCERCFNLRYSQLCEQCRDSAFLFDCRACSDCFGCAGLRQKKFHMFNEALKEEEYKARLAQFDFSNRQHLAMAWQRLEHLKTKHPRKASIGEQNENVRGNYIYESKDCLDSFGLRGCRDCRYCNLVRESNDCMDYFVWGDKAERVYECQECGHGAHNLRFCSACYDGIHNLTYCYQCVLTANNCFGCVGVKKREYCVLNKQYTKREYEELIPRIIEHMMHDGGGGAMNRSAAGSEAAVAEGSSATGSWGEFFPVELSPHAYNETVAQEYFPLTKEEVLRRGWLAKRSAAADEGTARLRQGYGGQPSLREGWKWRDNLPFTTGKETIAWDAIPDDIADVPDTICDEVLACEATGKNYRITKQELLFYRTFRIPIPHLHHDERHRRRMALRNPRKLWKRACGKCGKAIETTYAPNRPEAVYCESCYLKEVY